jgi:hypothetical protein
LTHLSFLPEKIWTGEEFQYSPTACSEDGIPVLLTSQVDSVRKHGRNDTLIPANVAQAVNSYQPQGIVHGEHDICAANPAHTKIIGKFRSENAKSALNCAEYPWYERFLVKAHTQIECDPIVWGRVESLIGANLPQIASGGEAQ